MFQRNYENDKTQEKHEIYKEFGDGNFDSITTKTRTVTFVKYIFLNYLIFNSIRINNTNKMLVKNLTQC